MWRLYGNAVIASSRRCLCEQTSRRPLPTSVLVTSRNRTTLQQLPQGLQSSLQNSFKRQGHGGTVQHLSTTIKVTDQTENVEVKSKNQLFREIHVHPGILAYIRSTGVGIAPRQNKRRRMNRITDGHRIRGKRQRELLHIASGAAAAEARRKQGGDPNQAPKKVYNPRKDPPPRPFGHDLFPVRIVAELANPQQSIKGKLDGIPQEIIPHIAVCGRSNVGKSTLLNALLYGHRPSTQAKKSPVTGGRKRRDDNFRAVKGVKAAISHRPGETRKITFYQLGAPSPQKEDHDLRLFLVDLPGYGFAYAKEEQLQNFAQMMRQYLTGGGTMAHGTAPKRILLLIDARHGMKKADFEFLETIEDALRDTEREKNEKQQSNNQRKKRLDLPPIQIVLTKCDLVPQIDLARRVVQVRQQLSDALTREPSQLPVMFVSVNPTKLKGVLELQKELSSLAISVEPVRPKKKPHPPPKPKPSEYDIRRRESAHSYRKFGANRFARRTTRSNTRW